MVKDYTFIRKDILTRTVIFEGVIETVSPLRIGAGKNDLSPTSLARDTVLKDKDGNPVIPGSSWKGIFRSTGERILRGKNIEVCTGVGQDYCLKIKRKDDEFQKYLRENIIDRAVELFWDYTCLNCKLFGTMSVLGNLRFFDSTPINATLGIRTMIAISRTEGAVASHALVTVEFVEPGSTFNFKLLGYNLPNYAIGYLVSIMKMIHDGYVQVGGHKSRGFGFVKFKELSFTSTGKSKIGDEDVEVNLNSVKEKGDAFFEKMKPYIEAFEHVKLDYPKK
ncbi:CRISPR-associated RAMP protein Csx7 [Sulfurisphaera javensis]|uniref:CRISPR-associated RAMP protein Csx7 n=1 Tax=Sulfurisphaera javensis TaxID=2049879 RepID=A0AAT9GV32_9CREN